VHWQQQGIVDPKAVCFLVPGLLGGRVWHLEVMGQLRARAERQASIAQAAGGGVCVDAVRHHAHMLLLLVPLLLLMRCRRVVEWG
jgi:hypothetical protein